MSYNQGNDRKHEVEKIKCLTKSGVSSEKFITVLLGDTRIVVITTFFSETNNAKKNRVQFAQLSRFDVSQEIVTLLCYSSFLNELYFSYETVEKTNTKIKIKEEIQIVNILNSLSIQ